jgi:hypothetical protein
VRGVRVAIVLLSCALACAKRAGPTETQAPGADAAPGAAPAPAGAAGTSVPAAGVADDQDKRATEVPVETPASLEELTASLDALEGELRGEGVRLQTYRKPGAKKDHAPRATPTTKSTTPPTAGGVAVKDEDPCSRICSIATAVCGLRERICLLADEHADEPRYAAACKRAERDCTRATEACDDCS